jgi:hypothetical protein
VEKFGKTMKKIYINESQLSVLSDELNKEVTFYEFFVNTKTFLKDLLNKPYEAQPSDLFKNNGIDKKELIKKMKDNGLIISSERIDEVPESDGSSKKVAKHFISYKIPKNNFEGKIKSLYEEMFKNKSLNEDGATTCGSVMQGGGGNPDSGQYTTPMGSVQRRKFWEPAMTRNKDEKNNSISMNRK